MTTNHPTTELSDEALVEIEARSSVKTDQWCLHRVLITEAERDAICQSLRALREKLDFEYHAPAGLSSLLDFSYKQRDELQVANTALREQLAEVRAENERLAAQLKEWQEEKDTKAGYL